LPEHEFNLEENILKNEFIWHCLGKSLIENIRLDFFRWTISQTVPLKFNVLRYFIKRCKSLHWSISQRVRKCSLCAICHGL